MPTEPATSTDLSAAMPQSAFSHPDLDPARAARLKAAAWAPDGRPLVTAVAQDADTGEVLMVAWMDAEALARTLATGQATYFSRSRGQLWVKGATSGHRQVVREIRLDCDGDAVLLVVQQVDGACHTGDRSCFDADILWSEEAESRSVQDLARAGEPR